MVRSTRGLRAGREEWDWYGGGISGAHDSLGNGGKALGEKDGAEIAEMLEGSRMSWSRTSAFEGVVMVVEHNDSDHGDKETVCHLQPAVELHEGFVIGVLPRDAERGEVSGVDGTV